MGRGGSCGELTFLQGDLLGTKLPVEESVERECLGNLAKLGVWVRIYPMHLGRKHQGFLNLCPWNTDCDLRMHIDARSGVQI